jgi:choline dehydrogenase-like flavoprotein
MDNQFDAIVIGSGISGGWAAKELCDKGLKVLLLERGRDVVHGKDYPTATKEPWQFAHRGTMPPSVLKENPVVARCYAFGEETEHFFVKDKDHPYIQEKPFDWIRAYQVGGKSLLWARQVQRWSKFDFDAPRREGFATEWPIGYDDMAPWYSHVESFAGISGNKDGLENLPDGEFLPPWEMNVVEKHLVQQFKTYYPDRPAVIGRCAHLTQPQEIHIQQGRTQCQARSLCERGCPFGGYFSSNASTIPWAQKTGNLTLKTDSVVHSIIYDDKLILLNSRSDRFPHGLGNDNGLLGKYICFHNYRGSISATYDGFTDYVTYGRRPTMIIMPSFRNVRKQEMPFKRGYLVAFSAYRGRSGGNDSIGAELKESMTEPGGWGIYMMMQGETIPKETNHVRLSSDKKDDWGIPQLITSVDYDENDEMTLKDFLEQGVEMLTKAGCKNIYPNDSKQAPGLDIHEMGGVRMGKDPKTSMLNKWNQFHNVPNVFVTDGACMTSTGTQNPSLTFMAITARAANYAADEFKKGNL